MKLLAASLLTAVALVAAPAAAQTTSQVKVSNDTKMSGGVVTRTHKVVHVTKHKTHRAKRILGVKIGHKTRTTKVVRKTSTSSNGAVTSTVKVTH